MYEESTKSISHEFPGGNWQNSGHSNRVFSVKFLPDDPQVILSGGWDSNIYIWDLRIKKSQGAIYGASLSGDTLDFKNGVILSGSCRIRDQVQLWDFRTRQLIESPKSSDNAYVYGC